MLSRLRRQAGAILSGGLLGGLLLGVLAGCGTGGSGSTTTAPMNLNVGRISNSVAFYPFYVAQQKGFFKDEGLTIGSTPVLGTGAKEAAALDAGSIDVALGVMTDVFTLANVGRPVKVIGALDNSYYIDIIVSKNFEQKTGLSESSPLAAKINALKGAKIGITGPGSGTEALVTYLFKLQGMNAQKDSTMVSLGSNSSAALAAMKAGRVDALSFFQPVGQGAEVQGIGDIFISPANGDVPQMTGELHGVVYTVQSVLQAKSAAITAFIRGLAKADAFIHGNTAEVESLMESYLTGLSPAVAKAALAAFMPALPQTPAVSQDGYNIAVQFHEQAGLIKTAPTYDQLVDSAFITKALS